VGNRDGPIKTFPLRGVKDSPPYMHDGRLLTLEDTVEFFNLILGMKLSANESKRCELPRPLGGYDRLLKRVGIQY
jgi:cytochrome c peroxidase